MQHVLFIQGAGSVGAYEEDRALANSLQAYLRADYQVWYPHMPNEADPELDAWKQSIQKELKHIGLPAYLVGHSIGASVLAKILSGPNSIGLVCLGLFLISGPFWHEDAFWRWDECALPQRAGSQIPRELPIYLYHGESDPFVPISHVDMYASCIPQAVVRRLSGRDHQLNNDLLEVAHDIVDVSTRLLA